MVAAGVIGVGLVFGLAGIGLTILAEGISEAMNCTAFGILLWVPSMIVAFQLTRKKEPRSP